MYWPTYVQYNVRALRFALHCTTIIQILQQGSYLRPRPLTAISMCAVTYKIISPSSNKLSIRTLFSISSTDSKRDVNVCWHPSAQTLAAEYRMLRRTETRNLFLTYSVTPLLMLNDTERNSVNRSLFTRYIKSNSTTRCPKT
jgi:hypothetical protein